MPMLPLPSSRRPGAGKISNQQQALIKGSSTYTPFPFFFQVNMLTRSPQFCDTLEVKNGVAAGPGGYGLNYALQQWGAWQIQTNNASEAISPATVCSRG